MAFDAFVGKHYSGITVITVTYIESLFAIPSVTVVGSCYPVRRSVGPALSLVPSAAHLDQ